MKASLGYLFEILTAAAAWISLGLWAYRTREMRVRLSCKFVDPNTPTFQNTGVSNEPVTEKVLLISNIGKKETYLHIDMWTSCNMCIPPRVETLLLHRDKKLEARQGHYGRYINVYLPVIPPEASVTLRMYCLTRSVESAGHKFFNAITIQSSQGKHEIIEDTN